MKSDHLNILHENVGVPSRRRRCDCGGCQRGRRSRRFIVPAPIRHFGTLMRAQMDSGERRSLVSQFQTVRVEGLRGDFSKTRMPLFLKGGFFIAVTFPVKSLDLVFFEIAIATLSRFFDFFKEVTIVLNRFSHRLVPKQNWKGKKIITKVWPKIFKI